LPYFEHDIKNVQQVTHENDQLYGSFADHIIKPTITPLQEDFNQVLGNDICNMITDMYGWYYDKFNYKQ
jgi:hypothetical protein